MEKKVKILIVQNGALIGQKQANFNKIVELLVPYVESHPDLIVFPEVWNVGWDCPSFPDAAEEMQHSQTLHFLRNIALSFRANVLGGSYIRKLDNGELRNTSPVYNREGKLIAMYDKMHLYSHCDACEGDYVEKGKNVVIATTDVGKIGLTICYDLRFPEIFRKYTYSGADLLVNMGAWAASKKNQWTTLQKARAIENQSFMIAVSQTGFLKDGTHNLGCSMVVDPRGEIVASLGENEGVLEVEIDLNDMYELRKSIPTLSDTCREYKFSEEE
ncbi:MAG: hypothetical protein PHV37_00110 [Candidatus Gastranaerophilales bacterium]|nr:hypothetical protein [Candidatus Gastranaerophilales bacterium]